MPTSGTWRGARCCYYCATAATTTTTANSPPLLRYPGGGADCFAAVLKADGIRGLYRGLGTQVMGVAPEKTIKLTVNDAMRVALAGAGGLTMWGEVASGVTAGLCQVVVTNPLEAVKVRLQLENAIDDETSATPLEVIRGLGPAGLYRGAIACLLRDGCFSGILFPLFHHAKLALAAPPAVLAGVFAPPFVTLGIAGMLAAAPAALLTTPFDCVKTRQQDGRLSRDEVRGVIEEARHILDEEGPLAFWHGSLERVMRSSPQFAVTLALYDILGTAARAEGLLVA